jgi:hypothetical protein
VCFRRSPPVQRFRLILDAHFMKELSVAEQKYQAVLAVMWPSTSKVAWRVKKGWRQRDSSTSRPRRCDRQISR